MNVFKRWAIRRRGGIIIPLDGTLEYDFSHGYILNEKQAALLKPAKAAASVSKVTMVTTVTMMQDSGYRLEALRERLKKLESGDDEK